MKLYELIERIDPPLKPYHGTKLQEDILGYNPTSCLAEHGFTERYISLWLCTDSVVGTSIIYRNNTPLCISVQYARKSSPEYYWISKEIYKETAEFIRSLEEDNVVDNFLVADLNDYWPENYKIEFTGQLIRDVHSNAIYQNKLFDIDWGATKKMVEDNYIAKEVALVINNEIKVVSLTEVSFSVKLKELKENFAKVIAEVESLDVVNLSKDEKDKLA